MTNAVKELMELLDRHVEQLGEHFDTVQVLCTVHDEGVEDGTGSYVSGSGNLYARLFQAEEFVEINKARVWEKVRKEEEPE